MLFEVCGEPASRSAQLIQRVDVGLGAQAYHYYKPVATGDRQDLLAIAERLNAAEAR